MSGAATSASPRDLLPARVQLTVQGWLNVVLGVMGVMVVAGAVAGSVLVNRSDDVSRQLIESIQPARSAAYQLQAALSDQETAVRGYLISADRRFLEPYFAGQRAELAAVHNIRQNLGEHSTLIADLDAIERASTAWRTSYAEPMIAGVTVGTPTSVSTTAARRGKAQFDGIRGLLDTQTQHLTEAVVDGKAEFNSVRSWRDKVLLALVGVFLLTALALGMLSQWAVTRPLAALAAACRRVTEGNFAERIVARGPRDVQGIATDVDDMRQRIVDELGSSQSAQARLVEQAELMDAQAIELRRSNAELEQFAYVASHDLQEPLRKVASFCQLLQKRYGDKLDERGIEYIEFAVDGAKRMQVLINDLLTFSRVGRVNERHVEVDLDDALDTALENLSTTIDDSGADISRTGVRHPLVTGDPTLLTMLWQNLIGNAMKFARDGVAPRIEISCESIAADSGDQWLLTVSDNGIGIPAEFADKVFVIFQRLHARTAYSGTGIGLAICKKIVEHHGGRIWIDPDYSEGTRFCMSLPIGQGSADMHVATNEEATHL